MVEYLKAAERKRSGRLGPLVLLLLAVILPVALVAAILLSGRPVAVPGWLIDRIEARLAEGLDGQGQLELGEIVAQLGEGHVPRLVLRDLALRDAGGGEILRVPELRATLSGEAAMRGEVALTSLTIVGAELALRRDEQGRIALAFGTGESQLRGRGTLPELIAAFDRVFARTALARLDTINGEGLRLTFFDARTGRIWRAEAGTLALNQTAEERSLTLRFALAGGAWHLPASVRIALSAPRGQEAGALELSAEVRNFAAADLAVQHPALNFLSVADASLSARLRGRIAPSGTLEALSGEIEMGEGLIRPEGAARPIPFESAKAALSYDPAAQRIDFHDISAVTPEARFSAEGQALIGKPASEGALPNDLILQLALADFELDPVGELIEPARFESGSADLRVTLRPFRIELGQLTLLGEGRGFRASGDFLAQPEGWNAALDISLDEIPHDRLFALWPLRVEPKTRTWLTDNVAQGLLVDLTASLRLRPGTEPRFAFSYEFQNGVARFLPTLPPIESAHGHAAILGITYSMVLREGHVMAPNGEKVDASGTTFTVDDINRRPSIAEIRLETESSIPAALTLLDAPPFEFLTKAGRGTDLAEGRARLSAVLRLPLVRDVEIEEVEFAVAGRLSRVRSETLVPGRIITADQLILSGTREEMTISGPARIGQARFDMAWTQPLFDEEVRAARVEGTAALDQAFLTELGITLPRGTFSGEGIAEIAIELPPGGTPRFRMTSNLEGIGLSIPALGWSKRSGTEAALEVEGPLEETADIDRVALDAPGLRAEGRIRVSDGGTFEAAEFSRVRAGSWLDAPVTIRSRGGSRAYGVEVRGGRIDLRETAFAQGGGAGVGGGGPVTLALDRLTVSEGIFFSPFNANLTTGEGLEGRFEGRLAGEAAVVGAVGPTQSGTAVRIQSADAGAVLRASGFVQSARRGRLDLTLAPRAEPGHYDGTLRIADLGLRGAPVLADLLGAISVVGLIEQLNGQGIVFNDVSAEFTLDPRGVTLKRGSAVGASLGVSMDGVYDLRTDWIDMRGTISPIYILNGIGQIFTRQGEGLFGFTYRMRGPADNPRTQVNPLSILTPGMFREIFRARPPELR